MRYVVIMAGGSGTRLWPLSRKGEPKQLLEIIGGKSLLRLAYERVAGLVEDDKILVCTGASYIDKVAQQIPELRQENLLGEPVGRDSLNAVTWPAAVLAARDPEAVIATVTADQIIEPLSAFHASMEEAFRVAEADPGALVTFGVVPTEPHPGYGYLKRAGSLADDGFANSSYICEFKEKPNRETAQAYLDSGQYWWNSGMFVWRAQTLLEQLKILKPNTYADVTRLVHSPELLEQIYPNLEKISVDYAVMEPVSAGQGSAHVVGVALPIIWHDVGSLVTLAEQLTKDAQANSVMGQVVNLDAQGNLLINTRPDTVLAVSGIKDTAVVMTESATLVIPLSDSQRVKDVVNVVATQINPELA